MAPIFAVRRGIINPEIFTEGRGGGEGEGGNESGSAGVGEEGRLGDDSHYGITTAPAAKRVAAR